MTCNKIILICGIIFLTVRAFSGCNNLVKLSADLLYNYVYNVNDVSIEANL